MLATPRSIDLQFTYMSTGIDVNGGVHLLIRPILYVVRGGLI